MENKKLKIAILASGNGTNAQAIIDNIDQGKLAAQISLIIANNPDAGVLKRAELAGIPHVIIDHRQFGSRESHDLAMLDALAQCGCQFIILAGYMRLLGKSFFKTWRHRILNIHPAILPAFPGTRAVADALAQGVKIIGATVHFVEEPLDSGPVIIQGAFAVGEDENEEKILTRMHDLEHEIYPQAIQWLAENRLIIKDGKVALKSYAARQKRFLPEVIISPPLEI